MQAGAAIIRTLPWAALACAAALAVQADAPPHAADPHLAVVPRTAAEAALVAATLAPPAGFAALEAFEGMPGGAATIRLPVGADDDVSQASGNIGSGGALAFAEGRRLFRKLWIAAPSAIGVSDGLGPLYTARSCRSCHLAGGGARPPQGAAGAPGISLRLGVPDNGDAGAAAGIAAYLAALDGAVPRMGPDPVYGRQLQDLAVAGFPAEGRVAVAWTEMPVALAGGEMAMLRRPVWSVADPGYGPLPADVAASARTAPPMIGLGLLEAIPAQDILAREDPRDADGDGISGRANIVWSAEFGRPMVGRFGWKAVRPTLREQTAAAFAGDMGISTPLFPAAHGDCTAAQDVCRAGPHGDGDAGGTEIDEAGLDRVTFYARNLAVPDRPVPGDPEALRGKAVFHAAGCAACHTPRHVTARLQGQAEQSFQLIWPHTDLLLHDLGPGLADGLAEGRATGAEWRTAPLWGLGLWAKLSARPGLLHDGRARSPLEAVLWHGGEGQAARDRVVALPPADRAALIAFLESL